MYAQGLQVGFYSVGSKIFFKSWQMVQKRQRKKQGSTCTTYKLDNYCWMGNVRFWAVKEKQPTLMKTICNWPSTSEHTSQWKSIRYLANGLDNQSKIITNVGKSVLYDQLSHVDQLSANKRWSVSKVLVMCRLLLGRQSTDSRPTCVGWS